MELPIRITYFARDERHHFRATPVELPALLICTGTERYADAFSHLKSEGHTALCQHNAERHDWIEELGAQFAHELVASLVETHLRSTRVIGSGGDFQHVFHMLDEIGGGLGGMHQVCLSQGCNSLFLTLAALFHNSRCSRSPIR